MHAAPASRDRAAKKAAMARHGGRIALLALMAAVVIAIVQAGGLNYLSVDYLKAQQAVFMHDRDAHPVVVSLVFCAVYVGITALSIPGATVLTLAAGALFGLTWGTVLVSFASTLGAVLAFGISRYMLRAFIGRRFPGRVHTIDAGVRREGWVYVLSLRLIPAIPSWLVNLLMGVTAIRLSTFWWATQLGTLPATAIYVGVGTRLSTVTSLRDAVSPAVLAALLALAVLPYATRKVLGMTRRRRA